MAKFSPRPYVFSTATWNSILPATFRYREHSVRSSPMKEAISIRHPSIYSITTPNPPCRTCSPCVERRLTYWSNIAIGFQGQEEIEKKNGIIYIHILFWYNIMVRIEAPIPPVIGGTILQSGRLERTPSALLPTTSVAHSGIGINTPVQHLCRQRRSAWNGPPAGFRLFRNGRKISYANGNCGTRNTALRRCTYNRQYGQHLYFYRSGALMAEGDVMPTGVPHLPQSFHIEANGGSYWTELHPTKPGCRGTVESCCVTDGRFELESVRIWRPTDKYAGVTPVLSIAQ